DRLPTPVDRVLEGGPDEALRTRHRHRLDADARVGTDVPSELGLAEGDEPPHLGRALLQLHAGVDVLRVLPEDDHVDLLGVLDGGRLAGEPAHRPQADGEVEDLAEGDVEAADAAADGRGQRPFDAEYVLGAGGDGG